MSPRDIEFLVNPSGKSPENLKDSIRRVKDASAGFRQSWLDGNREDAVKTSQEAFKHLDFIQNELLRQRDNHKGNEATWLASNLNAALNVQVGSILTNICDADQSWFLNLPDGLGNLPVSGNLTPLTLETALTKLKHRNPKAIKFAVSQTNEHYLFFLTNAGMGQQKSISKFDVTIFCKACTAAAHVV